MTDILSARYSVIDVESTGLNPKKDEIVAIAVIPMVGSRIILSDYFFSLVRPKKLKGESIKYHGIDIKAVSKAPEFQSIASRLKHMLEDSIIVSYTEFDAKILKSHFSRLKIRLELDCIDISQVEHWIARKEGRAENHDMDGLIKKYSLEEIYRHSALADAYYTACIFQRQLVKLAEYGVTLQELKRIGKREKFFVW
ncbi:3'-5' exonuclease [Archaeoglobus veneficus]|uniref:DNA polymerase III, epsilon subunit n=1 Tax=Archaeoglobus veneficus (strain DSM 11195 / SNP6) TaxID=693661 RepID=F2KPD5_ARCVS|nr:3'-5' exonuclease [Archaeoglobus veneficus]AEA46366.1 DNA polymerase III, epsilon subunit [Archaeoglobus veneficus SNP6]